MDKKEVAIAKAGGTRQKEQHGAKTLKGQRIGPSEVLKGLQWEKGRRKGLR